MELQQYWAIFRRWFWLPIGLAILAGALSMALAPKAQTSYVASQRIFVSVPLEPRNPEKFSYEGYYGWVASEYLVDDLSELVKSQAFSRLVAAEINDPNISAAAISGQQATKRTHRMLEVTVTGGNADQVGKIAAAIGKVINTNASRFVQQLGGGQATIEVVDPPVVTPVVTGLRGNLDIIVRAALGFAAGLALALLLHYLDTTVHSSKEATDTLGLPVLGEIPGDKSGFLKRRAAVP